MIQVGPNAKNVTLEPDDTLLFIALCLSEGPNGNCGVRDEALQFFSALAQKAGLEWIAADKVDSVICDNGRNYMGNEP